MNCQNFESIVDDLARDQMMEASLREQAQLHSASCASCAARLQDEQALTKSLRELSFMMRDENASDETEARVASAFRDHHAGLSSASTSAVSLGVSRSNRRYWNYAAAAGILLAVALGLAANRLWRPGPSNGSVADSSANNQLDPALGPSTPVPVATGQPLPTEAVLNPDSPAPRRNFGNRRSGRARVPRYTNTVTVQSLNILPPAEVTTGFIPIGYSNAVGVQEGGQIVRLEMPRYAMARFGVPINEERFGELVKADVWVGADGLARAIRFVQ